MWKDSTNIITISIIQKYKDFLRNLPPCVRWPTLFAYLFRGSRKCSLEYKVFVNQSILLRDSFMRVRLMVHVCGRCVWKFDGLCGNMPGRRKEKIEVTKANVKTLPNGIYAMGSNLYLRVRGERRNFFMRVMSDGERHDVGIGSVTDTSIAVAKAKALRIKVQIAEGKKPWEEKKAKRNEILFKDYFDEAIDTYAKTRQWKNERENIALIKYRINTYIIPSIGDIPVKDLTRDHVLNVIRDLWMNKPILANKLRFIIEKVCGIAMVEGLRADNPAIIVGNIEFFLPSISKVHKAEHHNAASFDKTKEILRCLVDRQWKSTRVLIVAILTARRLNEILLSKWEDWDFDEMVWYVPDDHMKVSNGETRRIPIPRQLKEIMRSWERNDGYIFSTTGEEPLRKSTPIRTLRRIASEDITVHGFRSVFIAWCAENGVDYEVAERCLDHETGNKVRQAYQRSDLLEQRREVLQRYADALFEPTTE